MTRNLHLACLTAIVALSGTPMAQNIKTLLANGATSNRYDLVIVGDGYQAFEESKFDQDALKYATFMFQREPYKTFGGFFNVHTVFRASNKSGANHPDLTPPVYNDPVYGATYNYGGTPRCLYITKTGLAAADAALAPSSDGPVLVLVNDSRYGGCGGAFAVSYNGAWMNDVELHELGHSFSALADEYDTINAVYSGPEPGEVNVTRSSSGAKWSHWIGYGGVSVYQGARYYKYGLWRPIPSCLMRTLGNPLCPVCRERITLVTNDFVSAIDNPQPASQSLILNIGAQQAFSFTNIAPPSSNAIVSWSLDGVTQAVTATNYQVDTTQLGTGLHTLEATVIDNSPLVRVDTTGAMVSRHTWTIDVSDPSLPDLQVDSVLSSQFIVQLGGTFDITTKVTNNGPAVSPPVILEHFLSKDGIFDASDVFLGSETIGPLAAGQSHTMLRSGVQIPAWPQSGIFILGAVIDREGLVPEQTKSNNTGSTGLLANPPGCTPRLEYRDPLLYPADSRAVSAINGGTALPTITAPCAAPGSFYVLAWSCSGTAPGTVIGNGITVPLNQDQCTSFSLSNANGPIFSSSFGVLDATGHGFPEFRWPPQLVTYSIPGHFVAVLIDPSPAFTGATNPVQIIIQ